MNERERTLVMGVLNVTPDSFYAPSRVETAAEARRRAATMVEDGAHFIDVGAESSRPGAAPIGADEELARLEPVLEALSGVGASISVDTYRASTATRAIELGAAMVNDITALRGDPAMGAVIASSGAMCVLMHMQGMPETMQREPQYVDVVNDVVAFFEERLAYAVGQGIREDRVWLDPGFGFGKTVEHNLALLRRLRELTRFGRPLLVGASNKSTIGAVLNVAADDRLEGTAATVAVAICNGAAAVRVHDVKAMARVATMCDAILGG